MFSLTGDLLRLSVMSIMNASCLYNGLMAT